jgi:hypothetical protein
MGDFEDYSKMRNADRIILELRRRSALDDDELASRVGIVRQTINQECRLLAAKGIIVREIGGARGKLVNRLRDLKATDDSATHEELVGSTISAAGPDAISPVSTEVGSITQIGAWKFEKICEIELMRDANGTLMSFEPQSRYQNARNLPLNKYGRGPFGKFKIPTTVGTAGVYAIIVNDVTSYIGECENLSTRYNMGYGNISPRNCFVGGQETNCRINTLIFLAATQGRRISLWFHKTEAFKSIERDLRSNLKPEWNRV